jgi:hypothetical protein
VVREYFRRLNADRGWLIPFFALAAILPPIYLFCMMQYSAFEVPYMDHILTAKYIIRYIDGTLRFSDLFDPLNQARPFFPRLFFILNAAATDWDIRSEYSFLYLTLIGALGLHFVALQKLSKQLPGFPFATTVLLFSIIACSPVAFHNHMWSLMIVATLAHLFITASILTASFGAYSWSANIVAAALAWAGSYSIGNAIFVFPAVCLAHQLALPKPWRPGKWGTFWFLNLVCLLILYLPGLPTNPEGSPTIREAFLFFLTYLGNPLSSLIWFPVQAELGAVFPGYLPALTGALLLVFTGYTAWRAFPRLRAGQPAAFSFFTLSSFAIAVGLAAGLGRSSGAAIEHGFVSRFALWSAYLLLAFIYYYATEFSENRITTKRRYLAIGVIGIFVLASTVSYVRAVAVYRNSHESQTRMFDIWYPTSGDVRYVWQLHGKTPEELYLDLHQTARSLFRLGIGPYRTRPALAPTTFDIKQFVEAIPLTSGTTVVQRIKALGPTFQSLSVRMVNWGAEQSSYDIDWTILAISQGKATEIGRGKFTSFGVRDWQAVYLPVPKFSGLSADEFELSFSVPANTKPTTPVGFPLVRPAAEILSPAVINQVERKDRATLGIEIRFDR